MVDVSQYSLPNDTDVCLLDCGTAFSGLTDKEKLYAHYISQASFYGGLIVLVQTSPESPAIFTVLQKLYRAQNIEELESIAKQQGLTDEEFKAVLIFSAAIYSNMGNYKSFGDSKIIPRLPKEKFEALVMNSSAAIHEPKVMRGLWDAIAERMYSLDERKRELGLGEKGTTSYYSSNCDENDAKVAQEFLDDKDISPYNTRLFKTVDGDGNIVYEVRLASAQTQDGSLPNEKGGTLGQHKFTPKDTSKSLTFNVTRGDYSKLMKLVVENLQKAEAYAENDNERNMLKRYISSFDTGSLPEHKDGSRYWIRNQGPIVETYIGFIESYRDPYGARGEFEGFVAVVNKEMSAKFGELVNNAEHLVKSLPWPASYEKDKFLRPDFTSLDVLSFGGSGIPAGINIPNYDDIRQNEGFKNVSLGNVLTSGYKDTKITFLSDEDKVLYKKWKLPSFEVQVGLHELLGHGSGKLFIKNKDGTFNFDIEKVKHTETNEKISCWYNHNETWDSKFTSLASNYEECRAECVGLYLCLSSEVLRIFGHTHTDADEIIYINWLNMVRAGLLALEFYSPSTQSWRQAHMNARYVILRVLLEAGDELVSVKKITEDGKPDLRISLDRSKINTVGKNAISAFLRKLQVYKSTGDYESAKEMFGRYSDVNDHDEPHFLSLRDIVLARKVPRKMFVQHHTYIEGEKVMLKNYDSTPCGLIESFKDRFASDDVDNIMLELSEKDKQYHF